MLDQRSRRPGSGGRALLARWGRVLLTGALLAAIGPAGAQSSAEWTPTDEADADAPLPEGFVEVPVDPAPPQGPPEKVAPTGGAKVEAESPETVPAPVVEGEAPAPMTLVLSGFGGYWGLRPASRQGYRPAAGFGLRAEVDPKPWFVTELWALYAGHKKGTDTVATASSYATLAVGAGGQYRRGPVHWAGIVGLAGTLAASRHQVEGAETTGVVGAHPGFFWALALKWRSAPWELRLDLASVWRGTQADLLLTFSAGWVFG